MVVEAHKTSSSILRLSRINPSPDTPHPFKQATAHHSLRHIQHNMGQGLQHLESVGKWAWAYQAFAQDGLQLLAQKGKQTRHIRNTLTKYKQI